MQLVMLGFLFFSSLMVVLVTRQLDPIQGTSVLFALVLAAGAIGQEVSSGVLTLTFARPLTRTGYVLSRWAGAAGFAAGLGLVQLAVALMAIAARGGPLPGATNVAAHAIECVLLSGTAAAVMVMLSSFMNGLGDVGVWALGSVLASVTGMAAQAKNWPVLARAAEEIGLVLNPKLQVGWFFGAGDPQLFALVSVLSTTSAALAIAVWIVNRKELSYAAG
jgi:ABC-type transport system involved in multi-copper enzyme maturation permease subunit